MAKATARHILVSTEDKCNELKAQIEGGADFAELAREHTDDPSSRERGGDLGWFTIDQFGPDFGAQVAGIEDGAISEPFKTQAGWHVVQRVGTRQAAAWRPSSSIPSSSSVHSMAPDWRAARKCGSSTAAGPTSGDTKAKVSLATLPAAQSMPTSGPP